MARNSGADKIWPQFVGSDRGLTYPVPAGKAGGDSGRQQSDGNPSGIHPIEFKVLVRPDKAVEKTKGGIHLPEVVVEKDQTAAMEGVIAAVSPLAFTYEEWPDGVERPKAGDRVIFARYAGINTRGDDGADYRLMNDKDIAAIRRPNGLTRRSGA